MGDEYTESELKYKHAKTNLQTENTWKQTENEVNFKKTNIL